MYLLLIKYNFIVIILFYLICIIYTILLILLNIMILYISLYIINNFRFIGHGGKTLHFPECCSSVSKQFIKQNDG